MYQIPDPIEYEQSVYNAIKAGYHLVDTVSAYQYEEAFGRAIKRSGVPREELFITNKLWIQNAGYERTKIASEKLLANPVGLFGFVSDPLTIWRCILLMARDGRVVPGRGNKSCRGK